MTCSAAAPTAASLGSDSCADPPAPPLIDVVTLSRGLPDGVYYAGRQLTKWPTFAERSELSLLRFRHRDGMLAPGDRKRLDELMSRSAGQSVVVRWELVDGVPPLPAPLVNRYTDGLGTDTEARTFTWNSDATEDHLLPHCLLHDAFRSLGHDTERSSNHYVDDVAALVSSFGDTWLLPQRRILEIVARRDLQYIAGKFAEAMQQARAVGLDPVAVLAAQGGA